jgi:hypothetical protein
MNSEKGNRMKKYIEIEKIAVANVLSEFTVSDIQRNPVEVHLLITRASKLLLQSAKKPIKIAA